MGASEVLDVIPDIGFLSDEPFADSSLLPTYLVSRFAREHVTVSLSGDGGDELFHGYPKYQFAPRYWRACSRVPKPLRSLAATTVRYTPYKGGVKVQLNKALSNDTIAEYFRDLDSQSGWERLLKNPIVEKGEVRPRVDGDLSQMLSRIDINEWLPDDILYKVDRASMAVSLEARVPMLDYRIVEFSAGLPSVDKVKNGQTKWHLRKILSEFIPEKMIDRPKRGFGFPVEKWLRVELRDWAESLLNREQLERGGLWNVRAVESLWQQFLEEGTSGDGVLIWRVLMFQTWYCAHLK